jgi:hypothetical protein
MLLIVFQLAGQDIVDDDVFLRKIWAHRVPELLEHMSNHHLLLNINTTALPSDNITAFLSRTIHNHLSTYNLTMPPSTRPTIAPQDGQSLDQANFYHNPWQLAVIGYRRSTREGAAYKLTSSMIPYHLMTWHNLLSGAPTTNGKELMRIHNVHDRPLIFIGTRFSYLSVMQYLYCAPSSFIWSPVRSDYPSVHRTTHMLRCKNFRTVS